MSNHDAQLRIFLEGRMQLQHPENNLFIRKELAKIAIDQPEKAAALRKHYEDKMAAYMAEHPEEFVQEPEKKDEVLADEPETELKRPRGRPKKAVEAEPVIS